MRDLADDRHLSVSVASTAIVYRSRSSSEGPPLTSNVVPSGDQANPVPPCCIDPPMTGKETSSRTLDPSASMTASVNASALQEQERDPPAVG